MDSINLEITSILNDRLKPDPQLEVHFKKPALKIWLPAELIPSTLLIEYCQQLVLKPSKRICDITRRIYNLLAVSKDGELKSLLNEFRSVTGLQLPISKNDVIMTTLKNMVGKACRFNELENIRRDILIEKIIDKRKSVLLNLKQAEMQINLIADCKKPLKVRNDYDLEEFPCQLRYINENVPYSNTVPHEVMIGCDCENGCSSSCLHLEFENEFQRKHAKTTNKVKLENQQKEPYDETGKILYPHHKAVFECNKLCKCDESCPRRVVQKGPNIQLEIFRTFNGCGWGVRTLEFISKGMFVTKYTGELIPWEDGNKRICQEYLFDNDIDFCPNIGHSTYTIDGFRYGNVARFVNHSCGPNLSSHVIYIDNIHPEIGEIVFFSLRDIEPMEELTINYLGLVKSNRSSCRCAVCCSR